MELDRQVRRNPSVVHRALGGSEGGVLLHLESGQYHGLNPTGVLIWSAIEDGATPSVIAERVRQQLDGAPDDLDEVVAGFLERMQERGLIR